MQLSRAMSLISASLAIGLAGCSNDGGFFPGTLSHNEGAVDYRVVPIIEPPQHGLADADAKGDVHERMLSLGEPLSKPYATLGKMVPLNSIERAPPQPQVIAADDAVRRKTDELRIANESRSVHKRTHDVRRSDFASAEASRDTVKKSKQDIDDRLAKLKNDEDPDTKQLSGADRKQRITDAEAELKASTTELGEADRSLATANGKLGEEAAQLTSAETAAKSAQDALDAALRDRAVALKAVEEAVKKGEIQTERAETVRVTLKQAYMRKFAEPGPVCEVAVLMTVKESRNGIGQQEPKSGRVVFYSEGVRKNAFMNFRDQPVYGPIRYNGDDLQIRISIIELDENDNAIAGGMLKTIASLGSVAFPPSSPVLAALDQIGASLLTLNGPDLEWDYLMRLSCRPPDQPGKVAPNFLDAWLRDGYFVLMRSDVTVDGPKRNRISQDEWRNLYLDARSGVVYESSGTEKNRKFTEYHERSYLVFAVQTGFDSSQLDLAQETAELTAVLGSYGTGSDSVSSAAEAMTKSLQKSIETTRQMKTERQRTKK